MSLILKLAMLALAAAAALAIGILIFIGTGSFFLVGCWCAVIATIVNEAQFGSRPWVERAILAAFVVGAVTIFGPLSV